MSGNTAGGAGTTTSSTDSGQGSEPLSDAFVAVAAERVPSRDSSSRVAAPEGAAQFFVRRSLRVASSRSGSVQASASMPVIEVVDAPPGGKRKIGYAYQVLEPVAEEVGHATRTSGSVGNVGSLRDANAPQLVLTTGTKTMAGRKRSATSAAPGSGRRGPNSGWLASAADFSPNHFEEPASNGPVPPLDSHRRSLPPSPMALDPEAPARSDAPHHSATPLSSPLSQNPLLQRDAPMVLQTPSPARRRPQSFRTQDSNAAWAAAEGLLPVHDRFDAPGYVPAQLVGGIKYTVRSPSGQVPQTRQPIIHHTSVGRQLFAEYTGANVRNDNLQQRSPIEESISQQQMAPHVQQHTSSHRQQTNPHVQRHSLFHHVRRYEPFLYAYIDSV